VSTADATTADGVHLTVDVTEDGAPATVALGAGALTIHRTAGDVLAERAVTLLGDRLSEGAPTTDSAVLARVNSALLPVQVALTEAGIAHTAPLDTTVLGRTGIRTALAYLRLGLDTERITREDLFDTLNRPARKVKSAVAPLLQGRGSRWSIGQLEQVADTLEGQHRERFAGYLGDLRHLERAITDGADTARCLWLIRNRIGLGEAMDALDASRTRPEGSSHGDDLDALEQLAALHPDPATFRTWLTERLRVPGDPEGVTLSTIHRVKGLEWPHVIVFAANQGLFPHRLSDDIEEERRVFHVAVTRCRERVDVLADRARPAAFVDELLRNAPPRPTGSGPATAIDPVAPQHHPDGRLIATPGVELTVVGGLTGRIVRATREGAEVAAELAGSPVTLHVAIGEAVTVAGDRVRLGPPRPTRSGPDAAGPAGARRSGTSAGVLEIDDEPLEVDDALFASLRAWRARVAAEHGLPAYLVFHDRHLQVIAGRQPVTLAELAGCPGVGPTKLERYGDDVLALVDGHRTG
jgi:hypothetical protein